jgi:hypothetical protein
VLKACKAEDEGQRNSCKDRSNQGNREREIIITNEENVNKQNKQGILLS